MLRAVRAEQIFFKETICNAHSLKPQNLLHNYWRDWGSQSCHKKLKIKQRIVKTVCLICHLRQSNEFLNFW